MYISIASDVQQIAHDLARYSARYPPSASNADICASMSSGILPVLVDASFLLHSENFTILECSAEHGADAVFSVTVEYDMSLSYVKEIARLFDLDVGSIRRVSLYVI
ncbi:hypothetical protein HOY34_16405 [Xinfangfangia sp. D13-10-4-6]|uniref:hypothetical protein n=1 Tax=Pseudogemmobacter hezensis TaxID=2737662 RepID=UPI0015535800|nr:hypothetical protein [Pseudogemmobacter hezensis]NPD16775.1 hypothetical protein [Pseudogemmobacter hezensis]